MKMKCKYCRLRQPHFHFYVSRGEINKAGVRVRELGKTACLELSEVINEFESRSDFERWFK